MRVVNMRRCKRDPGWMDSCVMVCVKEKLCDLQEAHLNSQMLPGWENMERLLGTESHRLFLDFPSSRRQSVGGGPDQWFKMSWFWWMQRSVITSPPLLTRILWALLSFFFPPRPRPPRVSESMCYTSLCGGRWFYSPVTSLNLCSEERWESLCV